MPEWLESLLQYGSGPLIAAAALLWQQDRNDKREDRRRAEDRRERQKDREHQTAEAGAEREAERALSTLNHGSAVEERWRDERLEAHANLLDLLSQRNEQSRKNTFNVLIKKSEFAGSDAADSRDEINAANARVQLLASTAATRAAQEARQACHNLDDHAWTAVIVTSTDHGESDEELRVNVLDACREAQRRADDAISAYREAARVDLGTD